MDLVYSEMVFLLVSMSGDERLFDDVDEEYSFGKRMKNIFSYLVFFIILFLV